MCHPLLLFHYYANGVLVDGIIHLNTNLDRTQFSQLPLPHLKVGYLTAPPVGASIAPHNDWKGSDFFLDHEKLQQVRCG